MSAVRECRAFEPERERGHRPTFPARSRPCRPTRFPGPAAYRVLMPEFHFVRPAIVNYWPSQREYILGETLATAPNRACTLCCPCPFHPAWPPHPSRPWPRYPIIPFVMSDPDNERGFQFDMTHVSLLILALC